MASFQSSAAAHFLRLPPFFFPKCPCLPRNISIVFPRTPLGFHTKSIPLPSQRNALPPHDQEILDAIAESDDGDESNKKNRNLPGVRTYENDLARLTVIGDVGFEQALTAAAADGGDAAEEHIASGISTMVVETVFPGNPDEHSTVSTRLFLPARKVKDKARKLRSTLTADILSSTTSRNILAMTFRQVVLHRLWSFELAVFSPGSERNMEDLANPREVSSCFSLSSSDGRLLSMFAEAVCLCALEITERDFFENTHGMTSNSVLPWFQKPKRIASSDSSIYICKISQNQIIENAKNLMENFNAIKGIYRHRDMKPKGRWWVSPTYSRLDKIGGSEFSAWTNEYIPAYQLQINAEEFKNVKFVGWEKSANYNRWEALLTHFQMVDLANILDMYYEDRYSIQEKQVSCGLAADFTKSKSKGSLWKTVSMSLAAGCILVSISIVFQLCWPRFFKARKYPEGHYSVPLTNIDSTQHLLSLEATELEALCISVIEKIKDALCWPGDIIADADVGAWIGELPSYLTKGRGMDLVDDVKLITTNTSGDFQTQANSSRSASPSDGSNSHSLVTAAQDIASFQVVLSRDGKIIGFQPLSRVAVNHWASNPLAKALYGGRKISPGLLEPSLKISCPDKVIQVELLMSVNKESWFALARPVQ